MGMDSYKYGSTHMFGKLKRLENAKKTLMRSGTFTHTDRVSRQGTLTQEMDVQGAPQSDYFKVIAKESPHDRHLKHFAVEESLGEKGIQMAIDSRDQEQLLSENLLAAEQSR